MKKLLNQRRAKSAAGELNLPPVTLSGLRRRRKKLRVYFRRSEGPPYLVMSRRERGG